jgi:transcriptional regulator of acetoin/glycerol metabolism
VVPGDLPPEVRDGVAEAEAAALDGLLGENASDLESIEASVIRRTIRAEKGNLTRVAAILGISRPTLYRKMRQFGIERG